MKIKFLCLNIWDGGILRENILDFLDREQPHLIGFQEVNHCLADSIDNKLNSLNLLKEYFSDWNYHFAPEFNYFVDETKVEIGNAVFSKFPITQAREFFFGIEYGTFPRDPEGFDYSVHPKNMQCCEIEINKQVYTVGNLHGIWGLDGADNPARLEMSRIIVEQIKEKPRVILAGDFNLKPNTQTIKNIEKHLVNIFKNQLKTSFNLKRKDLSKYPGYATAVVDMIFASKDIKILSYDCPQVDISDHLPLLIEFEA